MNSKEYLDAITPVLPQHRADLKTFLKSVSEDRRCLMLSVLTKGDYSQMSSPQVFENICMFAYQAMAELALEIRKDESSSDQTVGPA